MEEKPVAQDLCETHMKALKARPEDIHQLTASANNPAYCAVCRAPEVEEFTLRRINNLSVLHDVPTEYLDLAVEVFLSVHLNHSIVVSV